MEALINDIQSWLLHLREPQSWAQLLVIALAAGLAYGIDHQIARLVTRHPEEEGLRRLAQRTAQRLTFPISTLLGVVAGRAILHANAMPVQLLNIAVPMMASLAAIRVAVFLLRKAFAPSAALKAWEGAVSTIAWSVVVLHLIGWLPDLLAFMDSVAFQVGAVHVSLLSVGKMLLMLGLLLTLALWVSGVIEEQLKKAQEMSPAVQVGITKFLRFFLIALSVLVGLNAVGIDLTALTVFGGALGVGLGFGLQRIASNFISGFILIVDRSVRPGDVITVGNNFGLVKELRARYVVVRTRDGAETLIPNESLITSEVVNWSYTDRKVRLRIPVQISYNDDPERAMELMMALAQGHARVLPDPAPVSRLIEFAESGIALELRVWIEEPQEGTADVKSDLNLAIWKAFAAEGISFPYPHREVHVTGLAPLWAERPPEKEAAEVGARV